MYYGTSIFHSGILLIRYLNYNIWADNQGVIDLLLNKEVPVKTGFALLIVLSFLICLPPDIRGAFRVWAVGDGVRVDPVSGELIESMQTFLVKS